MSRPLALCTLIALAALLGCIHPVHHDGHTPGRVVMGDHGPPPHAPAHGYRHKHHSHGVDLVFDSEFGVYAVVGMHDIFFYDDHFYRYLDGGWSVSVGLDRGWVRVEPRKLPKGLARKGGTAKGHGKGRHGRPAKHGY